VDMPENLAELPFNRILEAFAARTPTPGGGAAAGLSAALGASLGAMAFRFSRKKDDLEGEMEKAAVRLEEEAAAFARAADQDCRAYEEVRAAYRLPKETEEEKAARREAIRKALLEAMASPLALLERIQAASDLLAEKAGMVKPALASDLASAAWCFRAGAEAAWLNVRINAGSLPEDPQAQEGLRRGREIRQALADRLEGVLARAEESL